MSGALLRQIELTAFGSHAKTTVAFDAPITFIVGPNASGKSTLAEAILWGLTGRFARGVDGGGRGAQALIAEGATAARVRLQVRERWGLTRTVNAGGQVHLSLDELGSAHADAQAVLYQRLDMSPTALQAVVASHAFLDTDHAAAKAFLMELLDVRVPIGEEQLTLAQLTHRYGAAFEDRKAKKAQVKDHRVPARPDGVELSADDVASLEAQLQQLREQEKAILADGAEARGRRQALVSQRVTLDREREDLEGRVRQAGDPNVLLDELEAKLRELVAPEPLEAVTPADEAQEMTTLRQQLVDERGRLRLLTTSAEAIKGRDPQKGCVLDPDVPCLTPAAEFDGRAKYLPKAIKQIERALDTATRRLNLLEAQASTRTDAAQRRAQDRSVIEGQRTFLEAKRRSLEASLRNLQADQERLTEVLAQLAKLDTELANAGTEGEPPAGLVALQARITKGDRTIADARTEAQRWTAYHQAAARATALAKELEALEASVAQLGPKGAQLDAIAGALTDFLARVNGPLERFGYRLDVQLDPWLVVVNGRSAARLSTSERLRVGLCLQLAIAELSGLHLVVLDNAEWLVDAAIRATCTSILFGWVQADSDRQAIVIKATEDDVPAVPGVSVVRLARVNGVSQVLQGAVACS